ncbi:MAG: acyl-CoA dehydrogenase [Gammaproteobacteria bacterium]|nr:acyl-CoA dehydrogenase [Gammaproteobacteria bacterium]MDE0259814.1 acyl-CoA dehydrogenase [Gammaproteobacteria bacterium]
MKESAVPTEGERRTRVHTDILAPGPAQAMLGLLDRDPRAISEGGRLPLGWHWLYFRQPCRASRLARDGHEVRGDFMPDIDLPRRMWAGGTLRSLRPVALGERAELRSEIVSITEKRGRSGRLVFVTVGHTVLQGNRRCVEEEQVIVYREAAPRPAAATARPQAARQKAVAPGRGGGTAVAAGADDMASGSGGRVDLAPEWTGTFLPTTVTLFQFSALTYNGHRIHYDHPYVTQQEGYPGLLVHGPLTALLLLDAAQRHSPRRVRQFRYRALAPLFVDQPIALAGHGPPAGADGSGPQQERIVEALAPSGAVAMRGWVTRTSASRPAE